MVLHLLVGSIRLLTGPFFLPSFTTPDPDILPISPSHFYGSVPLRRPLDVLRLKNSLRPLSPWILGTFFLFFSFLFFFISLLRPIVIINQFRTTATTRAKKENRAKA
ncbi:hypothetical protein BDV27DRAFT_107523 [Aspergillus caelatus]|uniref:Uncharacterized protein n=1 Tax=Aspergillus caelatus TaxID=61420 RepID=A0A5N7A5I6_9EURO|nr:uncharacterized protein BDV27DRAFT_107523 [Aspergillus caelatus]KAE8365114.1 hypothetical protein BDV27DRAFT_107523 [Aspergillus caelatus]